MKSDEANNARGSATAIPNEIPVETYRQLISTGAIAWTGSGRASKGVFGAKRASTEEDLQRLCVEWTELHTPKHSILNYLMHVPNGGARSKGEAGKLKAMGTKAGVPDFMLPRSRGTWTGLAIELKSSSGRLSYAQIVWLRGLEAEGYLVSVCRSLDAFESVVLAFLNGLAVPPPCVERGWDE
jgi:hypothetical protein